MTPDRHAHIRGIFLEVAARPPAERAGFLARRCGNDAELKAEVEKLLSYHVEDTQSRTNPTTPFSASDTQPSAGAICPNAPARGDLSVDPRNAETASQRETVPTGECQSARAGTSNPCPSAFSAGDGIAERYRIVNLLGKGGMGSVYRADDLILNQPVALKFLDPRFVDRRDWIERFRNEVRLARRVTHHNVCRVFDIGDCGGSVFLTMEYIDGEDVAGLIRRVGRLSPEKATDVAGQVCTGLAAAHGAGVLHRDLKPANIMLDAQGRVRLTDFGIAVAVHARHGHALRAGTPAYMSPEQIGGRRIDIRSDIYALGLVLYELFSGRPAFQADSLEAYTHLHEQENPRPLTEVVPEIDPRVDRLVRACLSKDPADRPPSALKVAAALPGVDVLSVAMSANQTPEPALVADASSASFRVAHPGRWAVLAIVACLLLPVVRPAAQLSWEKLDARPPVVLAERAAAILGSNNRLSPPDPALPGHRHKSTAFGYCAEEQVIKLTAPFAPYLELARGSFAAPDELLFWYRDSDEPLVPRSGETLVYGNSRASLLDPALTPGQQVVILDQTGRLRALLDASMSATPGGSELQGHGFAEGDSNPVVQYLEAAGLSPASGYLAFLDSAPTVGPQHCGRWLLEQPSTVGSTEVHACWSDGRAGLFVLMRMDREAFAESGGYTLRIDFAVWTFRLIFIAIVLACLPLAYKNYATGRADVTGAVTCGLIVLGIQLTAWVVGATYTTEIAGEVSRLSIALARAFSAGAMIVVLYLGLEPVARRNWPHLLIGWTRLLQFRRADRLVWEHVLVGIVLGSFWALLAGSERALVNALNWTSHLPFLAMQAGDRLLGGGPAIASYLHAVTMSLAEALLLAALLAFTRSLIRRPLAASVVVAVVLIPVLLPRGAHVATSLLFVGLGVIGLGIWVMTRVGLLSVAVAAAIAGLLNAAPLRLDSASWYRGQSILILGAVIALTLWAYRIAQRSASIRS